VRRAAALLAALALAGCAEDEPETADYAAWREAVSKVCADLRTAAEKLPDPGEGVAEGDLAALADQVGPIAALYARAARDTEAVKLPRQHDDEARRYVELFTLRADNYEALAAAARRGDGRVALRRTERDAKLADALATATNIANVRC
jgi:hypothetical protein